jgi:hypothetical protein
MNDAPILRDLVRLRTRDRVGDEAIDRMTTDELRARPEATVLAIVRGFYEFKSNGYAEADIYREIEGRRAQAYGEEPLPADLNLESYTCYRLRLEHPGEAALHDSIYAMQAVHRVREFLENRYGAEGTPVALRNMPWMHLAILVHATFVVFFQGLGNLGAMVKVLKSGREDGFFWMYPVLIAATVLLLVAAIGFVGRASWGRVLYLVALVVEVVVTSVAIYLLMDWHEARRHFGMPLHAINTGIALLFLTYVLRSERKPGAAPT